MTRAPRPWPHHFLKVRRSAEVSADWILHGLAKADAVIRKRTSARRLAQDAVLIQLPDLQDTSLPYAAAYAEAAARIRAAIPNGGLSATWLAQHVAPLTLHDAQVDVGAPRSAIAELTVETARAFSNALIRAARTFTAECGADGPAWIALNPQKGNIDRRPGWAEDERRASPIDGCLPKRRHDRLTSSPASRARRGPPKGSRPAQVP